MFKKYKESVPFSERYWQKVDQMIFLLKTQHIYMLHCGYSFSTGSDLKSHLRLHIGEKIQAMLKYFL